MLAENAITQLSLQYVRDLDTWKLGVFHPAFALEARVKFEKKFTYVCFFNVTTSISHSIWLVSNVTSGKTVLNRRKISLCHYDISEI